MPAGEGIRRAQAMTMMAGVLWGTSFVTIQWGLDDGFHPVVFAGVRFVLAFSSALAAARIMGPLDAWMLRNPMVWALGVSNAAGFLFQYASLGLTSATKAALITNLSLVLVAPMSYLWLRERFTATKVAALVAIAPGVLLLTTGGDLSRLSGSESLGDMLSLAAGFSWAFYIIISKKVLEDARVTVPSLTLWVMGTTAVILVPLGMGYLLLGGETLADVGTVGWATAVYTGVLCSTVAYLLWTRGLRGVTATVSAVLLLVMVVVSAVMDRVFQGTEMNAMAWGGAVILLVAMMMMSTEGDDAAQGPLEGDAAS